MQSGSTLNHLDDSDLVMPVDYKSTAAPRANQRTTAKRGWFSGRTVRNTRNSPMGAVRLDASPHRSPQRRWLLALGASMAAIAGIAATTAPLSDSANPSSDVVASLAFAPDAQSGAIEATEKKPSGPQFYFGDATDALGHAPDSQAGSQTTVEPAAPPMVQVAKPKLVEAASPAHHVAGNQLQPEKSLLLKTAVSDAVEEPPVVATELSAEPPLPSDPTVDAYIPTTVAVQPSNPVVAMVEQEPAESIDVNAVALPGTDTTEHNVGPEKVQFSGSASALPTNTQNVDSALVAVANTTLKETVEVQAGDTLTSILDLRGITRSDMRKLLLNDVIKKHLTNLRIGQRVNVEVSADGTFLGLNSRVNLDTRVLVSRTDHGFDISTVELALDRERVVSSGTIESSLYIAADRANIKTSTIMGLADIFQWELDFARDIRKGDSFSLLYERLYRDGQYIGDGDILAAEFVRSGKSYRAVRFTKENGSAGYYSPDGQSKRRTFLRHPVDVVRITSHFNPRRKHPVLHTIKAHRGVDYGAPHGSPVRAAADGVVAFAGPRTTYGNTVILKHGQKFSTLYAHMSKISDKSRKGTKVRQGDVIGYVGRTGRVTGTHLHYEFRINDKHVDPLKVELPAASPLEPEHQATLKQMAHELFAEIDQAAPGSTRRVVYTRATGSDTQIVRR